MLSIVTTFKYTYNHISCNLAFIFQTVNNKSVSTTYSYMSEYTAAVHFPYLDTWNVFKECVQGGEGISLVWIVTTVCAPPSSLVFPLFLN